MLNAKGVMAMSVAKAKDGVKLTLFFKKDSIPSSILSNIIVY